MLRWTITFIILAIIAGVFGFGGIAGSLVRLSKQNAEIFLDEEVKPLTNIKMNLKDVPDDLASNDFYGKVIERATGNGHTQLIRFTSISPEVKAYFQALVQYCTKQTDKIKGCNK